MKNNLNRKYFLYKKTFFSIIFFIIPFFSFLILKTNENLFEEKINNSFQISDVKGEWDIENQQHEIQVYHTGDLPKIMKYEIYSTDSSKITEDFLFSENINDIPYEQDISYFSIFVSPNPTPATHFDFSTEYLLKIKFGLSNEFEVSCTFTTTYEPSPFISDPEIVEITNHSIKIDYSWEQANDNSYKNNETIFEISEYQQPRESVRKTVQLEGTMGTETIFFDDLKQNTKYKITIYESNNKEQIANIEAYTKIVTTSSYEKQFHSTIDIVPSINSIQGTYYWEDNSKYSIKATNVTLIIYNKTEKVGIQDINLNDLESGSFEFQFLNLHDGTEYTLKEMIYYEDGTHEFLYHSYKTLYNDSGIELMDTSFTDGDAAELNFEISEADYFVDGNTSLKFEFSEKIYYKGNRVDNFTVSYDDITKNNVSKKFFNYDDSKLASDEKIYFTINIRGLPWDGHKILMKISLNDNYNFTKELSFNYEHTYAINPNSFKTKEYVRYTTEETAFKFQIEIKDPNNNLNNLQSDVHFTSSNIKVMSNEQINEIFNSYDEDYLYLMVDNKIITSEEKEPNFLVGQTFYISTIEEARVGEIHRSFFEIEGFILYFNFDRILYPLIIVMIILILLISILLIYIFYNSKKYRLKVLNEKIEESFLEVKNFYNLFLENPKITYYYELKKKNSTELDDIAKELEIKIPNGISKKEKVEYLSLLTKEEIRHAEEFIKYEMNIEKKDYIKAIDEIYDDKNSEKWIKRFLKSRLLGKVTIDKNNIENIKDKNGDENE